MVNNTIARDLEDINAKVKESSRALRTERVRLIKVGSKQFEFVGWSNLSSYSYYIYWDGRNRHFSMILKYFRSRRKRSLGRILRLTLEISTPMSMWRST